MKTKSQVFLEREEFKSIMFAALQRMYELLERLTWILSRDTCVAVRIESKWRYEVPIVS